MKKSDKKEAGLSPEIASIFDKLTRFRKLHIKKTQEEIAGEIHLNQNKMFRLEDGSGRITYLACVLMHYHRHYQLDLNSIFQPHAPIRLISTDNNLLDIVEE